MYIKADIKVNEKLSEPDETKVAAGWVTVEECIKFPVTVRKYTDKKTNKEKMFISYPQRWSGEEYVPVLYPDDEAVKKEIEDVVFASMKQDILREKFQPFPEMSCYVTRVFPKGNSGKVVLRGIATVKTMGLTISGILIKEGEKGLFVQMPQHQVDNQYKDTVYGITKSAQQQLRKTVLEAYEKAPTQKNPGPKLR